VYTCDIRVNVCVTHSLNVIIELLFLCEPIISVCDDLNYEPYECDTVIYESLLKYYYFVYQKSTIYDQCISNYEIDKIQNCIW